MTVTFQSFMRTVWQSLTEPADIAGKALALRIPMPHLWSALALIVVINVLYIALMQALSPMPAIAGQSPAGFSPFGLAGMLGLLFALLAYAVHATGRLFGGTGGFHDSLTLMVWFHAVSLTLETIQIVLALVSPYFAALFGMLALGGLLWCILNFIKVLHGFNSLLAAVGTFIMALLAMGFVAAMLLIALGIAPPLGTPA